MRSLLIEPVLTGLVLILASSPVIVESRGDGSFLNILEHPARLTTVEIGSPATIVCRIIGSPNPVLEWYHITEYNESTKIATSDVPLSSKKAVLPDGSLYFLETTKADEGSYACKAEFNHEEVFSTLGQLEVSYINGNIEFAEQPSDRSVREGETVTLKCPIKNCPKSSTTIVWRYVNNDRDREMSPRDNVFQLYDGSLRILDVRKEYEGVFYCSATCSLYGKTAHSRGAWLHIETENSTAPTGILNEPQDTSASHGGEATLACKTSPALTVQWWRNRDGAIIQVTTVVDNPKENKVLLADGSLYFFNLNMDDGGEYFCTVDIGQKSSGATSRTAKLTVDVNGKSIFQNQPNNHELRVGNMALLECTVHSAQIGESDIIWLKDHQLLNYSHEDKFLLIEDGSLIITNFQQQDAGEYMCKVSIGGEFVESNVASVNLEDIEMKKRRHSELPITIGTRLSSSADVISGDIIPVHQIRHTRKMDGWNQSFPVLINSSDSERAAYLDGTIYYCGGIRKPETCTGYCSRDISLKCDILEKGDSQWKPGPEMSVPRIDFTLNRVAQKLVAIGGLATQKWSITNSTEILENGEWKEGRDIGQPRHDHCTATFSDEEVIIVGGVAPLDDDDTLDLDLIQRFNIITGASTLLPSLSRAKRVACSFLDGLLVVAYPVYRHDHQGINSLEVLDLSEIDSKPTDELGTWYSLPNFPARYSPMTMLIIPGEIFIYQIDETNMAIRISYRYNEPNMTGGEWIYRGIDKGDRVNVDAILVPTTWY